jgi:hypothetical protein
VMSSPWTFKSPRKHTEKHGIFINNVYMGTSKNLC